MNHEYIMMYQITGCGFGLVLSSFFYSWGGRAGKWKRRFLASFVLAATVNVACVLRDIWSPWMIAVWPLLSLAYSLGYGAEDTWYKIVRRSIYASAVLMSGLLMAVLIGGNAWWVFIPHVVCGGLTVYLGIKNPLPAAVEEFMISMSLGLFLIAYPFANV